MGSQRVGHDWDWTTKRVFYILRLYAFLDSLHFTWNTFNLPLPPPHPMIILPEETAAILYFSWCASLHLKPSVTLQSSPDCPWSQDLNSCLGSGWLNVSLTPQTPSSFRPGINCCPSLLSAAVSNRCSALSGELNNNQQSLKELANHWLSGSPQNHNLHPFPTSWGNKTLFWQLTLLHTPKLKTAYSSLSRMGTVMNDDFFHPG